MGGNGNWSPELGGGTRLRNILVSTLGMLVAIALCSILGLYLIGLVLGEWVEPGAGWTMWLVLILIGPYLVATIATALRMWWNPSGKAGPVLAALVLPLVLLLVIGLVPGPD